MIPLFLRIGVEEGASPFVLRLNSDWRPGFVEHDAHVTRLTKGGAIYHSQRGELLVEYTDWKSLDRDVILVYPSKRLASRLIRSASIHNTLLLTEQCDQLCEMCSQPPKAHHSDMFEYLELAVSLAPMGARIGLSGGEPTLFKEQLFDLVRRTLVNRPDLSFHILTNGQHFTHSDIPFVRAIPRGRVLWGVPLYSSNSTAHDEIVGKSGAFARLQESFSILMRGNAEIELRTVVLNSNVADLEVTAEFISLKLPFVERWAIMQLERIGFGRKNWNRLFFDNSRTFSPIARAIDTAMGLGIQTQLYNFPLCTIPEEYREQAPRTISDWKQKYLDTCTGCRLLDTCSGFFEWYDQSNGYSKLGLQPL
ncbi:His-Xaa-Ser system radical SAM maturase HxsC [Aestuariivirga sp.]|uniref:His-Xaa-Ser system radical SAM maturase HxsC n=1 Tax=Aestuariivirga sp. TaxID=2650926 RepID=UPI003BAA08B6